MPSSLIDALLSSTPARLPSRKMPTGLLLLDNMITGIPLSGVTLVVGDANRAVDMFMKQLAYQANEHVPSKYKCVADFSAPSPFTEVDVIGHVDFVEAISEIESPVFCLSSCSMSIEVRHFRFTMDAIKARFCSGSENALVVYLDQQAGVPRPLVDLLVMHATTVLKFTEMDSWSLDSLKRNCVKKQSVDFRDYTPTPSNGVRITVIKRPLSNSLLRTAYFPFNGNTLSDAQSVFYHLLESGQIVVCGVDVENTYYCCSGINKFTFDEWCDSFNDLRSLLVKKIR